ncbi:MAG: metallophosphoesterase [Chloroflexi bacterium]|nr:MAG: metallophosphoesterase [Chloroflexota bacterium]
MRIALISDIHGNLISLEAVLADINRQQVDQIICLGDVATLGPQPKEVIRRVRQLGCPCIMGNHDFFVLRPDQIPTYSDALWFTETINWTISQLEPEDIRFLRSFQPTITIPLSNQQTLLCFHGSPHSNVDIILATTPPVELDRLLTGYEADVMAGGHTHVQMLRQHKGKWIVNVGSVGMPFEQMPFDKVPRFMPWAEYAIVEDKDNSLAITLCRVQIDLEAVKESAHQSTMPDRKDWIKNWGSLSR